MNYTISDLCRIVSAKGFVLSINKIGKIIPELYVANRYDISKLSKLSYFTTSRKENGFFLLSDNASDILYISFILNSHVGGLLLHNDGNDNYLRGNVTKRNLSSVRIVFVHEKGRKACNMLELIIERISRLKVDDKDHEVIEATVSFLSDIRNFICLEIYMKPIFMEHQVSILEPWVNFVEMNQSQYSLQAIDDTFTLFYKSIVDPENEVMDAMKKVRLFIWDLVEQMKDIVGK